MPISDYIPSFFSFDKNTLPTVDPSVQSKRKESYSSRQLAKAGLIFAGTVGSFLVLKTTGSFALVSSLLKSKVESDSELAEDRVTRVDDKTLVPTHDGSIMPRVDSLDSSKLTDFKDRHLNDLEIIDKNEDGLDKSGVPQKTYAKRSSSDYDPKGTEFQVNTYITDDQWRPSVAGLSDGKFVVTWSSDWQDGSGYGIYGQIYNTDGSKYSSEFQVNTYTLSSQETPSVAGLSDGRFVVTWLSFGQDGSGCGVYGQMFNLNGSKYSSEFQVNTYITNDQQYPSVAGLSDGRFVVTWTSSGQDGNRHGIYGQMYNTDGTEYLSEFQVNTYTIHDQYCPSVAGLSDGKFVVTWMSFDQDGYWDGVYGQMYNANGSKFLSEFQVNTYTVGGQSHPSAASLSDGKFVVTWSSGGQDGDGYGIYGQIFNVDGTRYLSEFQVNTYTPSDQDYTSVTGLSDNKFVVTWQSNGQDGDGYGIYGQIFNVDGTKYLSEFQVNTYTISRQADSSVAGLSDGKFVVTWSSVQDESGYGTYGQLFGNVIPILNNNFLIINEDETVLITNSMLSATDVDDDNASLTFNISNVQNG
ncbi:MAG: hypothetical protein AMJ43_01965, partial [Coxiella sp. DG_40]